MELAEAERHRRAALERASERELASQTPCKLARPQRLLPQQSPRYVAT